MEDELKNIIKRFNKDSYVLVHNGNLTKKLAVKPEIRRLRKNKRLVVGYDRSTKTTIFFKKSLM